MTTIVAAFSFTPDPYNRLGGPNRIKHLYDETRSIIVVGVLKGAR